MKDEKNKNDENNIEIPIKKHNNLKNISISSNHNYASFSRKNNSNKPMNYNHQHNQMLPRYISPEYSDEDDDVVDDEQEEMNQQTVKQSNPIEEAIKKKVDEKVTETKETIKKEIFKKIILPMLPYIAGAFAIIFFVAIIINILGPVIGGVMDLTNQTGGSYNGSVDSGTSGNITPSGTTGKPVDINISDLITERQKMITAAYSAIGYPYKWGGIATSPTLEGIKNGVDCSAFVSWLLWVGFGDNQHYTTETMLENVGKNFIKINYNELKPGDFGLRRVNGAGHTGMYVGNGQWIHASGVKEGIKKGNYNTFTYYLRYYKIPEEK